MLLLDGGKKRNLCFGRKFEKNIGLICESQDDEVISTAVIVKECSGKFYNMRAEMGKNIISLVHV